jgi:hypothetical protein
MAQAAAVDARQVADLSAVFTPDFSKVKRMTSQEAALRGAYEEQRADVVERIKNDYTEALHKEKLLETHMTRKRVKWWAKMKRRFNITF